MESSRNFLKKLLFIGQSIKLQYSVQRNVLAEKRKYQTGQHNNVSCHVTNKGAIQGGSNVTNTNHRTFTGVSVLLYD